MRDKKSFLRGALCGALAILLSAGLMSCGLRAYGTSLGRESVSKDVERKISGLRELIDAKYLGDVDDSELEERIYKGLVSGLEDPYSVYYDEEETKSMMESNEGEYCGIGAVLTRNMDTGIITLVQIYDDSPAMEAGLEADDILYKVEDKEVTGSFSHQRGEGNGSSAYGAAR